MVGEKEKSEVMHAHGVAHGVACGDGGCGV